MTEQQEPKPESSLADRILNTFILLIIMIAGFAFGYPLISLAIDQMGTVDGAEGGSPVVMVSSLLIGVAFMGLGGAMGWHIIKMWFLKK